MIPLAAFKERRAKNSPESSLLLLATAGLISECLLLHGGANGVSLGPLDRVQT